MESVKILLANGTMGSGKTTLSLALANYICTLSKDEKYIPTLFDCSDLQILVEKRKKELETNPKQCPSYEILSLPTGNYHLLDKSLDKIFEREAIYLFDVPTSVSQSFLMQLLWDCDIIICPLLLTDSGIYETRCFISFVFNAFKIFKKHGKDKVPEIILIPNMTSVTGCTENIKEFWEQKTSSFRSNCIITPDILWEDNFLNIISTIDIRTIPHKLIEPSFKIIHERIIDVFKKHKDTVHAEN